MSTFYLFYNKCWNFKVSKRQVDRSLAKTLWSKHVSLHDLDELCFKAICFRAVIFKLLVMWHRLIVFMWNLNVKYPPLIGWCWSRIRHSFLSSVKHIGLVCSKTVVRGIILFWKFKAWLNHYNNGHSLQ